MVVIDAVQYVALDFNQFRKTRHRDITFLPFKISRQFCARQRLSVTRAQSDYRPIKAIQSCCCDKLLSIRNRSSYAVLACGCYEMKRTRWSCFIRRHRTRGNNTTRRLAANCGIQSNCLLSVTMDRQPAIAYTVERRAWIEGLLR